MLPSKIAYILTPIDFGGAEKVSLNFLKTVDRRRFSIVPILLVRPWEDKNRFIQELEKENYAITTVPVALRPPSEGSDCFRIIRCFKRVYSILQGSSFDLVHTHGYFADIIGIPLARKLRIPVVSTVHGFISNDRWLRLYNFMDTCALRLANKVLPVSDDLGALLVSRKIQKSKIKVIWNGVDASVDSEQILKMRLTARAELNIPHEAFIIGYVGRLSPEKNLKDLLMAMRLIRPLIKGVRLILIGVGPQGRELEAAVKEWSLQDFVCFAGFQVNMRRWMSILDLFVLPSSTEGTPMALLEAMACGIPCVASAVGGVPDIICSGKNGLLVTPGKPIELKEAIVHLYGDIVQRMQFSRAARETIKAKYDIREWACKIEEQYQAVIQSKGRLCK